MLVLMLLLDVSSAKYNRWITIQMDKRHFNYTVYIHINQINGKQYVGITSLRPIDRWGKNGEKYKRSPHFYSAIQKYG